MRQRHTRGCSDSLTAEASTSLATFPGINADENKQDIDLACNKMLTGFGEALYESLL